MLLGEQQTKKSSTGINSVSPALQQVNNTDVLGNVFPGGKKKGLLQDSTEVDPATWFTAADVRIGTINVWPELWDHFFRICGDWIKDRSPKVQEAFLATMIRAPSGQEMVTRSKDHYDVFKEQSSLKRLYKAYSSFYKHSHTSTLCYKKSLFENIPKGVGSL